jgi:hypothetical protein
VQGGDTKQYCGVPFPGCVIVTLELLLTTKKTGLPVPPVGSWLATHSFVHGASGVIVIVWLDVVALALYVLLIAWKAELMDIRRHPSPAC